MESIDAMGSRKESSIHSSKLSYGTKSIRERVMVLHLCSKTLVTYRSIILALLKSPLELAKGYNHLPLSWGAVGT